LSLSNIQEKAILDLIESKLIAKIKNYNPEASEKPFHFRLLGRNRMAVYSFIQSVATTMGQSIFEKIAVIIAKPNFDFVEDQFKFEGELNESVLLIIDSFTKKEEGYTPNEANEDMIIREKISDNSKKKNGKGQVDVFCMRQDEEHLFEMKTAKPNIRQFADFKRQLLEWKAIRYNQYPDKRVYARVAIPYNPQAPEPYKRWTLQGVYDIDNEIVVAEEFWDFLGGEGTYERLLDLFEAIGLKLRSQIDGKLSRFESGEEVCK